MTDPDHSPPRRSSGSAPREAAERVGRIQALDKPAHRVGKAVRSIIGQGKVKDALSGRFLGHPLHPLLTDVPIGTWTSASLLDLFGGRDSEVAARRLVATGLLAALPTIASGYSDWADAEPASDEVRRIGIVHAAANATAVTLYAASYAARRRGDRGSGAALALAGAGALGVGGHLGGHLAYVNGAGVERSAGGPAGERPA